MTAQCSENLILNNSEVNFNGLSLFDVFVSVNEAGERQPYPFIAKGDDAKMTYCTALWRGYVSTYELDAEGGLTLVELSYPFTPDATPQTVHERLEGDFWLDLREGFFGPGVQVPFKAGRVVSDRQQWLQRPGMKGDNLEPPAFL